VPLVKITKHEQCLKPRRARWVEKYQQVLELHGQQCSRREIARQLHLDRGTVDRWLQAGCLPVRAGRTRHSRVETWLNYLTSRWQAGCTNAVVLAEELRQKGFTGSYDSVRRFVASWRIHKEAASTAAARAPPPSAKLAAWWLLKTPADRSAEQQQFVKILCEMCPVVDRAASLATEFVTMVRDRKSSELPDWLNRATAPESAVEMRRFAKGLQEDSSAVDAALSLPWSNGQTEGQVNRLKLIKRQIFGRAKFDLLRDRVLAYD
jgi:transposase